MREAGMSAFQTILLPEFDPLQIKRLNHLQINEIKNEILPIRKEFERAVSISESILSTSEKRIYFAANYNIFAKSGRSSRKVMPMNAAYSADCFFDLFN